MFGFYREDGIKNTQKDNDEIKKESLETTVLEKELAKEELKEYGTVEMKSGEHRIYLMSIIGEIEGHDVLPSSSKTTKYEHVLPKLAEIEENHEIDGVLMLLNTVGGDIESGLAIAEMIASMDTPVVSLVLGGSHSIGVPLAVSADYSYIVPTGTMVIHPVRMTGLMIGAPQTYEYFNQIQDRITGFIANHSRISKERMEELMLNTSMMSKDLGTILAGEETVNEGLINEVGGINKALKKLHSIINEKNKQKEMV